MLWISREISKKSSDKIKAQRIGVANTILTLSAGAIGLTFTVIQILTNNLYNHFLLKASWVIFGLSVLLSLVIQLLLISWEIYWDRFIDENKKTHKDKVRFKWLVDRNILMFNIIPWFEIILYSLFLIGVILLIIFLFSQF